MKAVVRMREAGGGRIRQQQESAILQAAERVFARGGFQGATMAEIAREAGLSKSNVHYYFGTKADVYRAVLANILRLWLAETDRITAEADPRDALSHYIQAKMRLSAQRPEASRVFANELLHGAPEIGNFLRETLREQVEDKAEIVQGWVQAGRIAPVDPVHLFISLWALTQTYADFEVQVCAVLGRRALGTLDHRRATAHVLNLVLRGCGLDDEGGRTEIAREGQDA
ncbi:MAG: TetR family transcriptional regulator C-terminal domain-containing protein [Zoogloeaceae bacterium]|nr:TetR family transcriptional regulator C-terminal domain-containing protein [Zoogloeaceae bacterium]